MMSVSRHYRIEQLPNGLIRVFDLASKLAGCYHADGTYAHGDLCVATIADLIASTPVKADEHPAILFIGEFVWREQ